MICPICQSELIKVFGKWECPLCTQINNIRKNRKTWEINPKTRIKESKKTYNRSQEKRNWQKEID